MALEGREIHSHWARLLEMIKGSLEPARNRPCLLKVTLEIESHGENPLLCILTISGIDNVAIEREKAGVSTSSQALAVDTGK